MTTVVFSEKGRFLEGAAQAKVTQAEGSGIGAEEREGEPATWEADREPQFTDDPQEGANGLSFERNFLNLIKNGISKSLMPELRSKWSLGERLRKKFEY